MSPVVTSQGATESAVKEGGRVELVRDVANVLGDRARLGEEGQGEGHCSGFGEGQCTCGTLGGAQAALNGQAQPKHKVYLQPLQW